MAAIVLQRGLKKRREGRDNAAQKFVLASSVNMQFHSGIIRLFRFRRVEFRYDLGSGPGVIRTHKKISLGRWHRIQARTSAAVLSAEKSFGFVRRPPHRVSAAHTQTFGQLFTKTLIVPLRSEPALPFP